MISLQFATSHDPEHLLATQSVVPQFSVFFGSGVGVPERQEGLLVCCEPSLPTIMMQIHQKHSLHACLIAAAFRNSYSRPHMSPADYALRKISILAPIIVDCSLLVPTIPMSMLLPLIDTLPPPPPHSHPPETGPSAVCIFNMHCRCLWFYAVVLPTTS